MNRATFCFALFAIALWCTGGVLADESVKGLPQAEPASVSMDAAKLSEIDSIVEKGIEKGEMPGAVVLVARNGRTVYLKAFGDRAVEPAREPMTADTIFDLASLTKPVATATGVLLLVERGKIALDEPATKYLPEFGSEGKDAITIRHLLTHQAGLIPDNALADYGSDPSESWKRICALRPVAKPEEKFIYSDVGFIVLGELVQRISGQNVADFAAKNIFEPLALRHSQFNPPVEWKPLVAPTEKQQGEFLRGIVHDPRAQRLRGVAGHAGLFSTAAELAVYSQMLLDDGKYHGRGILAAETVALMNLPHTVAGGGVRGLGWDMRTGYSSNRGQGLSDKAFGHGGFTGTALWIDPVNKLTVIFLSNRLHPDGKGSVNPLAGRIGTIAFESIVEATTVSDTSLDRPRVLTGIDVLERDRFELLKGRRVGLVTNQTGISRAGKTTIRLLHDAPDVKLVTLFSPEHGLEGKLDIPKIGDAKDPTTGLKVLSLYGETRRPTKEMLAGIDTIVFDIQDIGCRFYTYISTLGEVLHAAAEHNVNVVVLDRPNPIGGVKVAGPVLDAGAESFVGFHPIAVRHGMTMGEFALLFKEERNLNVNLQVVKAEGWKRDQLFDETGLVWVNPSPNMRTITAALLYPGVGLLETTNISVGRGTDRPFEILGAPWIDPVSLSAELNAAGLTGVSFVPTYFKPESSKFKGEQCGGLQIFVTDRNKLEPMRVGFEIAVTLRRHYQNQWDAKAYGRLLGSGKVLAAVQNGKSASEIIDLYQDELRQFVDRRKQHLLYD